MPGGRPRVFDDAEAFAVACEEYFDSLKDGGVNAGKMPTLAGLCLSMGFNDKDSFTNYATYGDEFSRTIKRAKMLIEDDRNQRLSNPSCTGIIFDLKNNHGWKDKTETEHTGEVTVRDWLSTAS